MKALHSVLAALSLTLLCASTSSATSPTIPQTGNQATTFNSPAPVPICPPEEGWCSTMPGDPPKPNAVNSPAPVPICPPEEGWCSTMPGDPPKPNADLNSQNALHAPAR